MSARFHVPACRRALRRLRRGGTGLLVVVVSLFAAAPIAHADPPSLAPFESVEFGAAHAHARPSAAERARVARRVARAQPPAAAAVPRSAAPDPAGDLLFKWLNPLDAGAGLSVSGAAMSALVPAAALGLPGTYDWVAMTIDADSPSLQLFDRAPDLFTARYSGTSTTLTDPATGGIPAYADLRRITMGPAAGGIRTDYLAAAALPTGEAARRLAYNLVMTGGGNELVHYIGASSFTPSGRRWAIRDRANRFPWWSSDLDLREAAVSFPEDDVIRFSVGVGGGLASFYNDQDAWPSFSWYLDTDNNIATGDSFSYGYQSGSTVFRYDLEGVEAVAEVVYDPASDQWLGHLRRKIAPGQWETVGIGRPSISAAAVTIDFERATTGVRSVFRWGAMSSFELSRGGQGYFGRVDVAPNAGMRLETATVDPDQVLAELYAPVVYRATAADLFPVSIEYTLAGATLMDSGGNPLAAAPGAEQLAQNATNGSYLDLVGNTPAQTLRHWERSPETGRAPTVYARVVRRNEQTAIQYWLHYFYSGWGAAMNCNLPGGACFLLGAGNNHEGDWEMIQINLVDDVPVSATYAQHDGRSRRLWQHVETQDGRPVVYVANGSHAGYFRDSYFYAILPEETGRVPVEALGISRLSADGQPPWLAFRGMWGADGGFGGSPRGPVWAGTSQMRDAWTDPFGWADGAPWDDQAHYGLPGRAFKFSVAGLFAHYGDVELRDTSGTALLADGVNRLDPTGRRAEFLLNCEADARQTVLIHKLERPSGAYLWLSPTPTAPNCADTAPPGPGDGPLALAAELILPDPSGGRVRRALYDPFSLPADGVARIALDAADLRLQLDAERDGVFEQTLLPTVLEDEPADFLPPEVIDDLDVADSVTPVRLLWTAPADDGPTGAAAAYEIRYATFPLTEETWDFGTPYVAEMSAAAAGQPQSVPIEGVPPGVYYFAVRAIDQSFNRSAVSENVLVRIPTSLFLPLTQRP